MKSGSWSGMVLCEGGRKSLSYRPRTGSNLYAVSYWWGRLCKLPRSCLTQNGYHKLSLFPSLALFHSSVSFSFFFCLPVHYPPLLLFSIFTTTPPLLSSLFPRNPTPYSSASPLFRYQAVISNLWLSSSFLFQFLSLSVMYNTLKNVYLPLYLSLSLAHFLEMTFRIFRFPGFFRIA